MKTFSNTLYANYLGAGMTRPDAEDYVIKALLPYLGRRPDEALRHVNAINTGVFDEAALPRVLPASLRDTIKAQAQREVAEYQADQKRWESVRALFPEAEAGNVNAMAALAAEYLNAPGGIEKNWANAMTWVNKVRARNSDAANATHNKVSAYVNQRSQHLLKAEDYRASIEFLEKVAGVFDFDAANCHRLGVLHASAKRGHTPDYAKAIPWFERAVALGSVESMLALGHLHVAYDDHPVDESVALKWFQQAATKGNVEAQQWVELLQSSDKAALRAARAQKIVDDQRYAHARGRPHGPNQINEWALLYYASNLGNGDAMAILGVEHFIANDDPEKAARGLAWLKKAEATGSVWGLRNLGITYLRGLGGVKKDVPLGLDYLARATELGSAEAGEAIGQYWREQSDWEKAEKAWLRAARMGSVTAKVRLAELAEEGAHRPQNLAEAIRLWNEVSAAEDTYNGYAMYRLGLLHREGKGVPKDETVAREWMRKGAEAGWPDAKAEWGKIERMNASLTAFLNPGDSQPNAAAGSELTLADDEAAAKGGDANALYRVGLRYQSGNGVTKDETRALKYFRKAADLGNADADEALAFLEHSELSQVGAELLAAQQSAMKREIDTAASASHAGVVIVKIPGADQAITAVRYYGGWYIAIGAATQVDGAFKSKVWFSRDARNWEHRFTAGSPLEDVAFARTAVAQTPVFLLVLADGARSVGGLVDVPTWICKDADGKTWQEIRGDATRYSISSVYGVFVVAGSRYEGSRNYEQAKLSRDAQEWTNHERVPSQFAGIRPPPRWAGRQMFDGRIYKATTHPAARWAVLSTDDLQNWREECLIPAPAAGQEYETDPQFCASEDTFLAGTMVAMGKGPVRFYRRKLSSDGWERVTPTPAWNYLHGLSYAGGRFVAVASREDLRVSKDGLRWKVVATVRPYSPRFAVGPEGNYVFGGFDGAIAIVTPDKSWDDFSAVTEPAIQTGAKWEKESTSKKADELFALARMLGASGPNPDAQKYLLQAVAVAETGSPETRLRLGMMLAQGSLGVPKDVDRGIALLASSAESGFALARLAYGKALIDGANGLIPVDVAKGRALLQAAVRDADAADAEAKFQIAALLIQGAPGIPTDRPRGFALLGAAADAGFAPAQFNFGQVLIAGAPEVPANVGHGVEMLTMAANQKVPEAAALLGQIYETGKGVTADLKTAKAWYARAVNLGFRQAQPALQRVEARLQSSPAP